MIYMTLTPEQIKFIKAKAASWIREQREIYRLTSIEIPYEIQVNFKSYFSDETLEKARFSIVPHIKNPDFYSQLATMGMQISLIDFNSMAGITFIDTILIKDNIEPLATNSELFFHELVHVVQYSLLGVDLFADRYISGFIATGFSYYNIPLERKAYELTDYYKRHEPPFSVETEIQRNLEYF